MNPELKVVSYTHYAHTVGCCIECRVKMESKHNTRYRIFIGPTSFPFEYDMCSLECSLEYLKRMYPLVHREKIMVMEGENL